MKVRIGLGDKDRKQTCKRLNVLLANLYVLGVKTKNFHWNLYGPFFHDLHLLFDAQYAELQKMIDDVAERTRTLGGRTLGTLQEFIKYASLQESPGDVPDHREMVLRLLNDYEAIICATRVDVDDILEKYHDQGTNNFLIDLMENLEKIAWMLRAILEKDATLEESTAG